MREARVKKSLIEIRIFGGKLSKEREKIINRNPNIRWKIVRANEDRVESFMHSRCGKTLVREKWKPLVVIGIFSGKLSRETISNERLERFVTRVKYKRKERRTLCQN